MSTAGVAVGRCGYDFRSLLDGGRIGSPIVICRCFRLDSAAQTGHLSDSMPSQLEIAVIVSTYQRPAHLERSLLSLAHQRGVDDKYEVIVTDDGSTDSTQSIVRKFARAAKFPVN